MSPQDLAERCTRTMLESDRASQRMGMTIDEATPGRAVVSMRLTDEMMNGFGMTHGGMVFALADSAFAFACNTYNEVTVAQSCHITFLRPSRAGETLTATAAERRRSGRNGIYDVTVSDHTGNIVAEFRGVSRTVQGRILPDSETGHHDDTQDTSEAPTP